MSESRFIRPLRDSLPAERLGLCWIASYDCSGAGQIVTEMFRGLSWRHGESTRRAMIGAFARVRDVQLLRLALRRGPAQTTMVERRLVAALASYGNLLSLDLAAARRQVAVLLRQIKEVQ